MGATDRLLCIGGPWDGRTVAINRDASTLLVAGRELNIEPWAAVTASTTASMRTVEYHREKLREGDRTYDVLFYSEYGRGVLETLLDGYRTAPVRP